MLILPKLWQREFPLTLFQIWGRSYGSFLGEKVEVYPRYVFIIKDGLGEVYRNPALTDAVNSIIIKKSQDDSQYLQRFYDDHLKLLEKLDEFYKQDNLTQKELSVFLNTLLEFWPGIYASWFIPPSESFNQEYKDLFLNFRKKIQHVEHEAHHLINRTIQSLNPELEEFVWAVSFQEVSTNKFPTKQALENRTSERIIVFEDEVINESAFQDVQLKYRFELERIMDGLTTKEIKGQIASPGKVVGKVRIVLKEADIERLKESDILVTSMTLPTFGQVMKKAAAFVTDEGGITSHAAINAREMNKPCIIGTKIGTQVLKDGEVVEVDADRGIIKILS